MNSSTIPNFFAFRGEIDTLSNGNHREACYEACIALSEFCCSEKGELLTMRLKILCEDRCEDIAVNLAAACVRSLRRSDQLRSLSESHHVHYMIDVYIVLLYKLKRTQDIFAQVSIDRKCQIVRGTFIRFRLPVIVKVQMYGSRNFTSDILKFI